MMLISYFLCSELKCVLTRKCFCICVYMFQIKEVTLCTDVKALKS